MRGRPSVHLLWALLWLPAVGTATALLMARRPGACGALAAAGLGALIALPLGWLAARTWALKGEALRALRDRLERQRRELDELTRRGREADRLKSAFIANMSHEIRTPLNSVMALSQLLNDGMAGPLSMDQRKYLEVIGRNGQNLLRLIDDILDLSRVEAGHLDLELETLEIGAQIRASVGTLAPLAESKGLDLRAGLGGEPSFVRGDAARVRQILTNLIGNAIKFTQAGQVRIATETRGEEIAVHVTDTGAGIPGELQARVFEEFFQVDRSPAARREGTGLGLAIARRLARLMDGEIAVESQVGAGSRFTLTLPRGPLTTAPEVAAGAEPPPAAAAFSPPPGASILVVEDDEDSLFTLRQILTGLSVELVVAGSGREALEHCRRRRPDVIVMDARLPGMSGPQAAGLIRALPGGAAIPIVALTAQAMRGDRERILAAGCDEYLAKPIQPQALLAVMRRLLDGGVDGIAGRGGGGQPPGEEEHGAHTAG